MNITNESVAMWLNQFYTPLSDDLGKMRLDAEAEGIPIILKDSEMFLLNLMRIKKPEKILEVGTAVGYSAACFAHLDRSCRIVSIESDERMFKKAVKNVEALGISDRVRIICGDGEAAIDENLSGETFDFVFIDAAKSHYKRFWDAAVKHCMAGAVIVSDNVLLKGATVPDAVRVPRRNRTNMNRMRKYIDELMSLEYADTAILAIGDGMAVSVIKADMNC